MTLTAASPDTSSIGRRSAPPPLERPTALAPRLAMLVMASVFGGFYAMALVWVFEDGATPQRVALAIVAGVTLLVMQFGFFSRVGADLRSKRAYGMLVLHLLVSYLPLIHLGNSWVSLQAFSAGNALLVLPAVPRWIAWAVIALSVGVIGAPYVDPPYGVPYLILITGQTGLIVYGLSKLRSVVSTLHDMRSELARVSVAEDRLRFARDVHDLLGSGLSALVLKSELAHRLIVPNPARAARELAEILDIGRRALADARSVAAGGHRLRLAEELESARSILAAAEVELSLRGADTRLPEPIETVFATILREGITNVLRHGAARRCSVTIGRDGATAVLEIVNDCSAPSRGLDLPLGGSGLANLTRRIDRIGGTLIARLRPDGTFLLRAEAPLDTPEGGDGAEPVKTARPAPASGRRFRDERLRFPELLVWTTLGGYSLIGVLWVLSTVKGAGPMAFAFACIGGVALIQLGYFANPRVGKRPARSYGALLALAALTFTPIVVMQNPHLGTPGLVAGSILLTLRPAVAVPGFLAVALGIAGVHAALGSAPLYVAYGAVSTAMTGLVTFGMVRLIALVASTHAARRELADLAVMEQRLQFGQQLQELVGRSLSNVIARGELAMRLCADEPERARAELGELLRVARQALTDVRKVASGHRDITLDSESSSVRSVLTAAGIDPCISLAHGRLPQPVQNVLAMVLREGATNVLRHSEATRCAITTRRTAEGVILCIVNDGASATGGTLAEGGGVDSLRSRLTELGGSLEAEHGRDGLFMLRAHVPLPEPGPQPG
ncbi:MAG: hypothetical protein BUE48_013470 [Thermomonospora sp. CIF 1]|nr:MAG: hypothetical protein BUE48_013470 [Thermomonospora sp. CIF 1]